ncbi:hypothetical protein FKM82_011351 [Ascaphus truei]
MTELGRNVLKPCVLHLQQLSLVPRQLYISEGWHLAPRWLNGQQRVHQGWNWSVEASDMTTSVTSIRKRVTMSSAAAATGHLYDGAEKEIHHIIKYIHTELGYMCYLLYDVGTTLTLPSGSSPVPWTCD